MCWMIVVVGTTLLVDEDSTSSTGGRSPGSRETVLR